MYVHCVSKNVINIIVINFYKLESILIIFGTLHVYAETTGFNLNACKIFNITQLCCYTTRENINLKK